MRIKICGITNLKQGRAIAQLGATALGFICVRKSPRYLLPETIGAITSNLPPTVSRIGVFANTDLPEIISIVQQTQLTGVQLHGLESPQFCQQLRSQLPDVELMKAIAVKTSDSLDQTKIYADVVDTFLFDAYAPQQLGGTGKSFNWELLKKFTSPRPWFLAGGLNPNNIQRALKMTQPDGIDLSSGVEQSPGNKDLHLVENLFKVIWKKEYEL
ncbi:UNVERIFIED_CONTAM: N-(5'-phosphoribosyl)anthranilate isomerase [Euhalothece sp. KZN 001]